MTDKPRRPSASPVCSADEAPRDYMLARALAPAELDGLLTAILQLERHLGNGARLALVERHLTDPAARPIEPVGDEAAAAALLRRLLPLVADDEVRRDLETLRRLYESA